MAKDKNAYKEKGRRVRLSRKQANMSREELAERIHYEASTIAAIEQGARNLTLECAERIAHACNVSLDYLLLRSVFMTRQEEIQTLVEQLQLEDDMWVDFIFYIASRNLCLVKPADRTNCEKGDIHSPYMLFEKDDKMYALSLREINDFMREVERHSVLSLQIMLERSRRNNDG